MYFQIQKREDRTIDENCVSSVEYGEYFAQLNVMEVSFGMNLSPYCASNPGKNEDHDTLFMGIIQGFAKTELLQETSHFLYLKKYRALRP